MLKFYDTDWDTIWIYSNPNRELFPDEYHLSVLDDPDFIPYYRELDLMLERHGCIDAPLP